MGKVYDWFEERLEIQAIADDVTSKYVPPHVNIFYCIGGITFVCFIIQVATGFAMTFYYRPTVAEAFASVEYIMTEVNYGWLFRSMHRWSASMMVLMMILHIFRVYLTGGFKKPRELTWVTGVTLAVTTVSFGVTGYSLPWLGGKRMELLYDRDISSWHVSWFQCSDLVSSFVEDCLSWRVLKSRLSTFQVTSLKI
jgi:cytochrome b6